MKCLEILKDRDLLRKEEIFLFFKKHGLKATLDAFKISRSTFYQWKKKLRENKNDVTCLKKKSTCPTNIRQTQEGIRIRNYKNKKFLRQGKTKITVLLKNNECLKSPIPSVSTIGNK